MLNTEKELLLVAIDGRCGSGKTTLGIYLKKQFDCNLFHMDDFFLQGHQRTEERLNEIGGNVDYERFEEEVLSKLMQKKTVNYRRFDCGTMRLKEPVELPFHRLNIVEGSYSQHPIFGSPYDILIFMDILPEDQMENIRIRNGKEKAEIFYSYYIPKEEAYFEKYKIKEKNIVILW